MDKAEGIVSKSQSHGECVFPMDDCSDSLFSAIILILILSKKLVVICVLSWLF